MSLEIKLKDLYYKYNLLRMSVELPFIEIAGSKESLKFITAQLEDHLKTSTKITLNEAYLLQLSLNNLTNAVNALDRYQQFAVQFSQNKQAPQAVVKPVASVTDVPVTDVSSDVPTEKPTIVV